MAKNTPDKYVMPNTTDAQDEFHKPNKPQKKYGITKSNRQVAKEVFGADVYDEIDEARKGSRKEREVGLHSSLGTKQVQQGGSVLEIDFAGSTFAHPRKDYTGIKDKAWDEGKKDPKMAADLERVYGQLVDADRHVREKISEINVPNPAYNPDNPDPAVPKETTQTKKRISIAGPGLLNLTLFDDNTIEKNKAYILMR